MPIPFLKRLRALSAVHPSSPAAAKWPALSLLAISLLYALTIPRNFTEAEDAVYYAEHVSVGLPQWHPNHLFYEPVNDWIVRLVGGDAVFVMQSVSMAAALASLALIWALARAAEAGTGAALAAIWAVAGSFAFWLYGLYPDTYAVPLPFVLGSVLALFHRRVALAACLAAVAALLHQSHVFLWPAAILWLYFGPRNWVNIARYSVIFIAITGGAYVAVGRLALDHASIGETLAWARGYASGGLWTPLSVTAPVKALVGLTTAIWSTLFLFADPSLGAQVERFFPGRLLVEEAYFAETGLMLGVWPLLALTVISAVGLAALAGRAVFRGPRHPMIGLVAAHGAVYAFAVTIWEPTNKEFWIAVLPFLALVLFLRLDPMTRAVRAITILALAGLWVANGAGAMVGFSDRGTDYWYQANRALIEETQPADVIVDDCAYICTGYLLLFSPAEILPAGALDMAEQTGPGRILITGRARAALDADPPRGWPDRRAGLERVRSDLDPEFYEIPRLASP